MAEELSATDVFKGEEPIKKLVKHLEDIYPCLTPSPYDDLPTIMYRAGQRSVVDFLIEQLEK